MGINIWPRIFHLTQTIKVGWNELEALCDNFNQGIITEVIKCEFTLAHVARIGFAKDSMAEPRNNLKCNISQSSRCYDQYSAQKIATHLSVVEGFFDKVQHLLVRRLLALGFY